MNLIYSFCLEDNHCSGVDPKYDCENYGDQGITAGCKDIYYYNIDCQWIDVTELPLGTYTFKMAINPEYKVSHSWEGWRDVRLQSLAR